MNKKSIFLFVFLASLCMAGSVSAAGLTNPLSGIGDFPTLFTKLAEGAKNLVTALSSLMIIVGGIFFLLSAGNAGMVTRAKSIIFFACIGILVALASGAIIDTIKNQVPHTAVSGGDVVWVLGNIAGEVGGLMAGLGTIMVIVSGFFFLASVGSPEKMKLARTVLIYAIIGIVIGLLASTIVNFITGALA